jgi:hypothetical protein
MSRSPSRLGLGFVLALGAGLAGCAGVSIDVPGGPIEFPAGSIDVPGGTVTLPGVGVITLEVLNDTGYEIDPRIRYDDDSGFWAGLWPADELGVHSLAPGELYTITFDCDALGMIVSDEAEQFIGRASFTAPDSRRLERDNEYHCGDRIQFQFLGDGDSFDVVVAVNDTVVD